MTPEPHPPRRHFMLTATALAAVGTAGCQTDGAVDRQLRFARLDEALAEAQRLAAAPALAARTAWALGPTLAHCAQSIEFSMTGFPQPKSALFQRTVGAAAFGVFAWRGRMSHDLAEPIPGAPALDAGLDTASALQRLQAAVEAFQGFGGPLQPHFAYGALDKPGYEQAHAMHLSNHLSAFTIAA